MPHRNNRPVGTGLEGQRALQAANAKLAAKANGRESAQAGGSTHGLHFTLRAPLAPFDRRVTPIRGDLADIALAGRFFAPHYVEPRQFRCGAESAMMLGEGQINAIAVSQLLPGEAFAVLDIAGEYCWGYSLHDGYCGYVARTALADNAPQPTHIVAARAALVFAEPDIKTSLIARLPMGSQFSVTGESEDGRFWQTANGYISKRHAVPIDSPVSDPVALAHQLIGAPYLWGGRDGDGLDCSGLVQLVLGLSGIDAPRDSDQQMECLGRSLGLDAPVQRGDLVFFPGHVGIMADDETLIHANAYWMQTVAEPLADVIARFPSEAGNPVLARKRLD